jgi:hypothetical protein
VRVGLASVSAHGEGWGPVSSSADVASPPWIWRVVRHLSPFALPERYDPWQARRLRETSVLRRQIVAGPTLALLAFGMVGVAVHIGVRILWATVVLIPYALIAALAVAMAPRNRRKLLEALDRPEGIARPRRARRSLGIALLILVNLSIVLNGSRAISDMPWLGRALSNGSGCHPPDLAVVRNLVQTLRPGAVLDGVAVVDAGRTRAVVARAALAISDGGRHPIQRRPQHRRRPSPDELADGRRRGTHEQWLARVRLP